MWAGLNPLADPVWPTGRIFGNPALNQIRECVCEEHKHMYCISRTGILKQADWHFQRIGLWELILVAQLVLIFFCNLHFFFFPCLFSVGERRLDGFNPEPLHGRKNPSTALSLSLWQSLILSVFSGCSDADLLT